jgi:hypothetical protein
LGCLRRRARWRQQWFCTRTHDLIDYEGRHGQRGYFWLTTICTDDITRCIEHGCLCEDALSAIATSGSNGSYTLLYGRSRAVVIAALRVNELLRFDWVARLRAGRRLRGAG